MSKSLGFFPRVQICTHGGRDALETVRRWLGSLGTLEIHANEQAIA